MQIALNTYILLAGSSYLAGMYLPAGAETGNRGEGLGRGGVDLDRRSGSASRGGFHHTLRLRRPASGMVGQFVLDVPQAGI